MDAEEEEEGEGVVWLLGGRRMNSMLQGKQKLMVWRNLVWLIDG